MNTADEVERMVAEVRQQLRPTPHPLLPWFNDAEVEALLRRNPAGLLEMFRERERRIELAGDEGDPLRFGFELPNWKDADGLLKGAGAEGQVSGGMTRREAVKFVYVAGGKRAGKSEWAAKRFVRAALTYPRGKLWAFQGNSKTSIATQQALVWKFLPPEIKQLNGKLDKRRVFSVNYSPKNGFADGVLVLPNRTEIYFLTYEMEVKDYQGWEIGAVVPDVGCQGSGAEGQVAGEVPNIGWWADENMPLPWLETCEARSTTRNAKGIWTFSTIEGITTTIKEVLGTAVTVASRPAPLLGDRVNVPEVPRGHMPYIQKCGRSQWAAIYFFSEFNVFGNNYAGVKALCAGRSSEYIEENAYGYARDVMNKAFPLFGAWNVIEAEMSREGAKEAKG